LDLDGDGAETLSVDAGVRFDMGADGTLDRTGWVAPDDGLLALDRNGNGAIDDHSELFGTMTTDGFTILSGLDSNGDGRMDAGDARFGELLVWQDENADGVSQAGELKSLAELGIESIDLGARQTGEMNNGNFISHESTFTYEDGRTGEIVDAWFALGAGQDTPRLEDVLDTADAAGAGDIVLDGGKGKAESRADTDHADLGHSDPGHGLHADVPQGLPLEHAATLAIA